MDRSKPRRPLRDVALVLAVCCPLAASAVPAARAATPPELHVPVCDAGGPYSGECNGLPMTLQLDGSKSYDPNGLPLQFHWGVVCGNAWLDDPTSPTPTLFIDTTGICAGACLRVRLNVTSAGGTSGCTTSVSFQDSTPPVITCPPDITITSNQPTAPTKTGFATATDGCNPSPTVTWSDQGGNMLTGVVATTITRTWTADDGCQQSSCVQKITIVPFIDAHFDMEPLTCPNVFPLGEAPMATVTGSILGNEIDVIDVDPSSIYLTKLNLELAGPFNPKLGGGGLPWDKVRPISINIADSETPFDGPDLCDCQAVGPDGVLDMDLTFDKQHLIQAFELGSEPPGTEVPLEINGALFDGSPFKGTDCILIL